jgi:hypothetical protein
MRSEREIFSARKVFRAGLPIDARMIGLPLGTSRPRGALGDELAALDEHWIFKKSR